MRSMVVCALPPIRCAAVGGAVLHALLAPANAASLVTLSGFPQVFPVPSNLVPLVVAAAFILPAALAGVLSLLRRVGRLVGPVLGMGLMMAGAAALAVYATPALVAGLRI